MPSKCPKCGRGIERGNGGGHGIGKCQPAVGVFAVHENYGCDSGCCGHGFYILGADYDSDFLSFEFMHDKDAIEARLGELAQKWKTVVATDRCRLSED